MNISGVDLFRSTPLNICESIVMMLVVVFLGFLIVIEVVIMVVVKIIGMIIVLSLIWVA